MEIELFYYVKAQKAQPLPTDMLVIPFGCNARSLALLAPVSEWIRDTRTYTHLINSDAVVLKNNAVFVDTTRASDITFFVKHISGFSIHTLVTTCLDFAVAHGCAMIDMPVFTANGFTSPTDDIGIMKTMIRAINDFAKTHDGGSLEISFVLDEETQQHIRAFCTAKGIQYSGRLSEGTFKR